MVGAHFKRIGSVGSIRTLKQDRCQSEIVMHSTGETSQGSGERGELVQSFSKENPGSPDASELGSPRCPPNFDLLNMVVSYKRMAMFLEPVVDAVELIRYLLGWKMPVCSFLVWIFLNVFFCTVTKVFFSALVSAGWFIVIAVAVSAPAALGYLQDRCGSRVSEAELQKRRFHAVHRRDLQTVNLTKQEAMLEIKDLLKHLDEMLSSACRSAEAIYKVLYWDDHATSSRFYGALLIVVCLLYVAPLGWVLAGLNSVAFLWNKDFHRVLLDVRNLLPLGQTQTSEGMSEEQEQGNTADQTPTPTSLEDLSPGSIEEAEEAEPDDEFKDAIEENSVALQEDDDGPLGAPEYDTVSENGFLSRNEPIRSKVSKLTERLRKRYPTTSTGNCSSCNAVFSVLKKRRNCSNCGNSFCSRCCSFKVLRSCMGATAPEAQRETVIVCAACNSSLLKLQ
ncbi:protrudin isoform X2 [Cyprinodon tularosa]|uniref:protrudin isoform X2 n=1 Tax=Cyprinodon tularosa TaxID=77115 RepID=UPI0018E20175|nr:protrudin isoform X2 [Cyprinodon tularosa]